MQRNKNLIVKKRSKKKLLLVIAAVFVALGGGVAATELTGTTHFLHERKAVSSTIAKPSSANKHGSSTKDKSTASSPQTPNPAAPTANAPGSPKEGDATTNTNAPLIEPYGDFVSNHTPGKNGSPLVETSVCVTTPGATCTITFTNAANPAIVKTLAAGTADGSGAVYWNNWDVRSAGFTSGIWNIKATATLNGQTKSTADSAAFEVHL